MLAHTVDDAAAGSLLLLDPVSQACEHHLLLGDSGMYPWSDFSASLCSLSFDHQVELVFR